MSAASKACQQSACVVGHLKRLAPLFVAGKTGNARQVAVEAARMVLAARGVRGGTEICWNVDPRSSPQVSVFVLLHQ
jgi:hypothetical protein